MEQVRGGCAEILENGGKLAVAAGDGCRHVIDASLLWSECPSAQGRARRALGRNRVPPRGLLIRSVREIGLYGLNIAFSDGHDRGIYPWSYLETLARRRTVEDFLYD